jgi:hypothetical protein
VNEVNAVPEGRQTLPRDANRIPVAIDADENELGKPSEECLRVAAHSQGRVNENSSRRGERRSKEFHGALEEHGGVSIGICHGERAVPA